MWLWMFRSHSLRVPRQMVLFARDENVGLAKGVQRRSSSVAYPLVREGPRFIAPELFTVLGIETSCDDTAAAVVRSDGAIIAEAVVSQHDLHAQFGGVVPGLAKEAHERAIEDVVDKVLATSPVDAVAVTAGPGLEICLRVGARKAVAVAEDLKVPFVACHHLEAHCLVARLHETCDFPFLALLVSGGHCMILKVEGVGKYDMLGGTMDDALGEAYDKAARMLGLATPTGGGPALERLASTGNPRAVKLPVPMRRKGRKNCDFSYAGLKNALRVEIQKHPEVSKADMAASFQRVAITHLEDRLSFAFDIVEKDPVFRDPAKRTLAVVGGVAANLELRRRLAVLCERSGWNLVVPPPKLCTDNGVMVAWAAIEKLRLGKSDDLDDTVYARWPFRRHHDDGASEGAEERAPPIAAAAVAEAALSSTSSSYRSS